MDANQSTTGLNFTPPSSLIDAMSEIQQFYLVESSGQPLHRDFFTMAHTMGFSSVGIRSALKDSVIWILGYVFIGALVFFVQENYLSERTTQILFWRVQGSPLYLFSKIASYGGLTFSTAMCVLISRYYTGTIPKRAINSLFLTRALFLISFSLLTFVLLGSMYRFLLTDTSIENVTVCLSNLNKSFAEKIYYFLHNYLRRALFEASMITLISSAFSVTIPFISIALFKIFNKKQKELGLE